MIKTIIGIVIFIFVVIVGMWLLNVMSEVQREHADAESKRSLITQKVQRCNELRNGGFFSSVGQPVGSTTPNPNPEQGYQNCIKQAKNP